MELGVLCDYVNLMEEILYMNHVDGKGLASVQHHSNLDATREAKRLCEKENAKVCILKVIKTIEPTPKFIVKDFEKI